MGNESLRDFRYEECGIGFQPVMAAWSFRSEKSPKFSVEAWGTKVLATFAYVGCYNTLEAYPTLL